MSACYEFCFYAVVLLIIAAAFTLYHKTHNINAYYANQALERRYEKLLIERARAQVAAFDPHASVTCQPSCDVVPASFPMYTEIDRRSKLSTSDFYRQYVFTGLPVIITDVGDAWPIRQMNLDAIAALLPHHPVVPRSAFKGAGLGVRGLRVWERYMGTTLARLTADRHANLTDAYYYSFLNVDERNSLLERGLYTQPYFVPNETFIAEWLYIGQTGTGVLPHIDHMCMAKWSYQLRGRKRWTLRRSVESMKHLGDLEFVVNEGEFLFFLPDHEHGTMCLPPHDNETGSEECLSIHGYIELPFEGNCYLQKLMQLGHQRMQYQRALHQNTISTQDSGFVRYARPGQTKYDAPTDYYQQCPPTYRHNIEVCAPKSAQTLLKTEL